jgi:hypothetical protein
VYLAFKGKDVTPQDTLVYITYLLLQDRVDEALALFSSSLNETQFEGYMNIQFDYLRAYLSIYSDGENGYRNTKAYCEKYIAHP